MAEASTPFPSLRHVGDRSPVRTFTDRYGWRYASVTHHRSPSDSF